MQRRTFYEILSILYSRRIFSSSNSFHARLFSDPGIADKLPLNKLEKFFVCTITNLQTNENRLFRNPRIGKKSELYAITAQLYLLLYLLYIVSANPLDEGSCYLQEDIEYMDRLCSLDADGLRQEYQQLIVDLEIDDPHYMDDDSASDEENENASPEERALAVTKNRTSLYLKAKASIMISIREHRIHAAGIITQCQMLYEAWFKSTVSASFERGEKMWNAYAPFKEEMSMVIAHHMISFSTGPVRLYSELSMFHSTVLILVSAFQFAQSIFVMNAYVSPYFNFMLC